MNFNWGKKITVVYVLFVLMLLVVVWFSFRQDPNMVTDNYYEKELTFQSQIEKEKRGNELPVKPIMYFNKKILTFTFPKNFDYNKIGGKIHLYRPSDYKQDIIIPIELDSLNKQEIGIENIEKGLWKVKLDWFNENITYFNEFNIMVQ